MSSLRPPASYRYENHLGLELLSTVPGTLAGRMEGGGCWQSRLEAVTSVRRLEVAGLPPGLLGAAPPCQAHRLLSPASPQHLQRCQEGSSTCGVKKSAWAGCKLDTGCACGSSAAEAWTEWGGGGWGELVVFLILGQKGKGSGRARQPGLWARGKLWRPLAPPPRPSLTGPREC